MEAGADDWGYQQVVGTGEKSPKRRASSPMTSCPDPGSCRHRCRPVEEEVLVMEVAATVGGEASSPWEDIVEGSVSLHRPLNSFSAGAETSAAPAENPAQSSTCRDRIEIERIGLHLPLEALVNWKKLPLSPYRVYNPVSSPMERQEHPWPMGHELFQVRYAFQLSLSLKFQPTLSPYSNNYRLSSEWGK